MDRVVTAEKPVAADRTSRVQRLADGRRIGYAEFGDAQGAAVLAIHGTPGSRLMFALTDKAARDRRLRIVAPERPGYGLSDFRRKGTLTHAADDMTAFADALGLDRFAVIGVSGGGPYAIAAAASMADRIALLALISPVGPIAECQGRIRMSNLHRLIFTKMGALARRLRHVLLVGTEPGAMGAGRRLSRAHTASCFLRPESARAPGGEGQSSGGAKGGLEARHRRGTTGLAVVLRALGSQA